MPEEINRILTDQISDLLFLTEKSAAFNLEREGINAARMRFVGNVMIDTLYHNKAKAIPPAETLKKHDVGSIVGANSDYAIVTLHRPSNVDDPIVLKRLLTTLAEIGNRLPVIFPLHPRTRARIDTQGFWPILEEAHVLVTGPLGYLELLGLMASAKVVLTDSGGLQEETTALGIPCITLRENTERPITETEGTNTVVGSDPEAIGRCLEDILETGGKTGRVPELWDGQAASRIAETIRDWDFSKSP
jgi:UDP-N-acetylglucosamine 2-epimerase (non-hydrolysing)